MTSFVANSTLLLSALLLSGGCAHKASAPERSSTQTGESKEPEGGAPGSDNTSDNPSEIASEIASDDSFEARMAAILASPHRTDEARARDAHRHPAETLAFFGLDPSMTVIELYPGGVWYRAILAPFWPNQENSSSPPPIPKGIPSPIRSNGPAKCWPSRKRHRSSSAERNWPSSMAKKDFISVKRVRPIWCS